jgi:hypothetical protein
MKKIITIALTILSLVFCTNLDEVWAELRDHEECIQKIGILHNHLNIRMGESKNI